MRIPSSNNFNQMAANSNSSGEYLFPLLVAGTTAFVIYRFLRPVINRTPNAQIPLFKIAATALCGFGLLKLGQDSFLLLAITVGGVATMVLLGCCAMGAIPLPTLPEDESGIPPNVQADLNRQRRCTDLINQGHFQEARTLALTIVDPQAQSSKLGYIELQESLAKQLDSDCKKQCYSFVQQGNFEEARKKAMAIVNLQTRNNTLADITRHEYLAKDMRLLNEADAWLAKGNVEEASAAANKIADPNIKKPIVDTIEKLKKASIDTKKNIELTLAELDEKIANESSEEAIKELRMIRGVMCLIFEGKLVEARDEAIKISSQKDREVLLAIIENSEIEASRIQPEQQVNPATNGPQSVPTDLDLQRTCLRLIRRGNFEEANQVASRIVNPKAQTAVFNAIQREIEKRSNPESSQSNE